MFALNENDKTEMNRWLTKIQAQDAATESIKSDPASLELKEKWLGVIEQYKLVGKIAEKIEAAPDELREEIGKLIYEGRLTEEAVYDLLVGKNLLSQESAGMDANAPCMVCTVCTACSGCATCAVCFVTGVVVASLAAFVATSASTAAYSS